MKKICKTLHDYVLLGSPDHEPNRIGRYHFLVSDFKRNLCSKFHRNPVSCSEISVISESVSGVFVFYTIEF